MLLQHHSSQHSVLFGTSRSDVHLILVFKSMHVFFLQTLQRLHLWLKRRKIVLLLTECSCFCCSSHHLQGRGVLGQWLWHGGVGPLKAKVRLVLYNIWEEYFSFLRETGWDILASWGSCDICLRNIFKIVFRWNEGHFCKLITLETWRAMQFKSYKPEQPCWAWWKSLQTCF